MITDIKTKYDKLFRENIPKFETIHQSLVTIINPHGETNLSNLLGYLLKGDYHLLLKEIVLSAITEHVSLQVDEDVPLPEIEKIKLEDILVRTEYPTKFGRIDLLIVHDPKGVDSVRTALIIENKLYHTLNNDLDDYFYTVCSNYDILPENVVLIVLSLKKNVARVSEEITLASIMHRELKGTIEEKFIENKYLLNDRNASLIINEYFMHIDDIYMRSSSPGNKMCVRYFIKNRDNINRLYAEMKDTILDSGRTQIIWDDFDQLNADDKVYFFDNKTEIDNILSLRSKIFDLTEESLKQFLRITNRNMSGSDSNNIPYFRGRSETEKLIRYHLDYSGVYNVTGGRLELNVWLSGSELTANNSSINAPDITRQLKKTRPNKAKTNAKWIHIHEEILKFDDTLVTNALRDVFEKKWDKFEDVIKKIVNKKQLSSYNAAVPTIFNANGYATIDASKGVFAKTANHDKVRFSIKYTPPDYIELILFVNESFGEKLKGKIDKKKHFIIFNESQSVRIPKLPNSAGKPEFIALLKKSYRISSLSDLGELLKGEFTFWQEEEDTIVAIINEPVVTA